MVKSQTFIVNLEDKEVTFEVRVPDLAAIREGQRVYNTAFSDAIQSKALVRGKLNDFLKDQGLWDAGKEAEYTVLKKRILDGELALATGGIKKSEAKKVALDIIKARDELTRLISVRTSLDNNTAEGQADNAKFSYLVSVCTVYNDTKQAYFTGLDDYLNRSNSVVAQKGAETLGSLMYGLDSDYQAKLPENKFLKEFGFVDDKFRLINKSGHLVDEDNNLVNEDGHYVNENEELIDKDGHRVDKDGNYVLERKPFLDDDEDVKPSKHSKKAETKED